MTMDSLRLRVGCCGFPRAHGVCYAQLGLVEVQQTFYRLPRVATALHWRTETPAGFVFTLKAWQAITHEPSSPTYRRAGLSIPQSDRARYGAFKPSQEVHDAWASTLEIARALSATVVVFQTSARFTPTAQHVADLRDFFRCVERDDLHLAWEPRGAWSDALVHALCADLTLVHCVDPFRRPSLFGAPAYFRLHGREGYRYRYTDDDLSQLRHWCKQHSEVYCLFNNVSMWEDALRFSQIGD